MAAAALLGAVVGDDGRLVGASWSSPPSGHPRATLGSAAAVIAAGGLSAAVYGLPCSPRSPDAVPAGRLRPAACVAHVTPTAHERERGARHVDSLATLARAAVRATRDRPPLSGLRRGVLGARPSTTPATATRSSGAPPATTRDRPRGRRHQPRRPLGDVAAPVRPRAAGTRSAALCRPSSVDWTEDGVGNPLKLHAHEELVSGVLKGWISASTASSSPTGRASARSPATCPRRCARPSTRAST